MERLFKARIFSSFRFRLVSDLLRGEIQKEVDFGMAEVDSAAARDVLRFVDCHRQPMSAWVVSERHAYAATLSD